MVEAADIPEEVLAEALSEVRAAGRVTVDHMVTSLGLPRVEAHLALRRLEVAGRLGSRIVRGGGRVWFEHPRA